MFRKTARQLFYESESSDGSEISDNTDDIGPKVNAPIISTSHLRELEDYRYALDESSIVTMTDEQGLIIYANQKFCELSKYRAHELIGKNHSIINSGFHEKEVFNDLWSALKNGKVWRGELRNKAKDGTLFWCDTTIVPFMDEDNKPYQFTAIRKDITRRKQAEEEALQLAAIVDSSRDSIISLSLEDIILSWNHAAKVLYGYSSEEVIGKPYSILLHPGNANEFAKKAERLKAGEQLSHFESEHVRKDGQHIDVMLSISPVKDQSGNMTGISASAHDISEHKRAEAVLNQVTSKERSRRISRAKQEFAIGLFLGLSVFLLSIYYGLSHKLLESIGDFQNSVFDDALLALSFLFFIGIAFSVRRYNEMNKKGQIVQGALKALTTELEMRVQERTSDLSKTNHALLNEIIERKKAEQSLKQSEEKFRTIFASSTIGNALTTPDGKFIQVNRALTNILGYSWDEIRQLKFWEITHPDDADLSKKYIEILLSNKQANVSFEKRYIHKNGSIVWASVGTTLIRDEKGQPQYFITSISDITDRKKADEQLKIAHERLLFHVENAPLGFIEWDKHGRVKSKSKRADEIFGWSSSDNENPINGFDYVYKEDIPIAIKTHERITKDGSDRSHAKHRNYTKDGRVIWCEWFNTVLRDEQGEPLTIMSLVQDITDNVKADEQLKQSESRFREMFDSAPEGIVIYDVGTRTFIQCNDNALKLLKYSKEDLLKLSPLDICPEFQSDGTTSEEKFRTNLLKALNGERPVIEWLAIDGEGEKRIFEIRLVRLSHSGSDNVMASFIDITERLNAEKERQRITSDIVQRNKDLEQFSYIVSHNLRAPVANIKGLAEILREGNINAEETEDLIHLLSASVLKLNTVITDLNTILQTKRNLSEQRQEVSFSHILKNIRISISEQIKKEAVEINSDFSAVDKMETLKTYLYSIFINLITNSIKYRQPGVAPVIDITSYRDGNKIKLVFKDNGLGIDLAAKSDQVFGLYKRFHTHTEGKGMGLYMVKTQVESLGGKISVASEPGKGTQFTIEFENQQ